MNNVTNLTVTIYPNNTVVTVLNQTVLIGANASGYVNDPYTDDSNLSENERLLLACVALLVPVVCAVIVGFGIRKLVKRESGEKCLDETLLLCKKRKIDPNKIDHAYAPEELKTSDTQFSEVQSVEELDEVITYRGGVSGGGGSGGGGGSSALSVNNSILSANHTTSKSTTATANGSIITMTMKNNHLIVETEEPQSSISGVDAPTILYGNTNGNEMLVVELQNVDHDQRALVHQEADPLSTDVSNLLHNQLGMTTLQRSNTNTGMSQSDLSSSSAGSICHPYDYGNQSEYISDDTQHHNNLVRSISITCPLISQSSQEEDSSRNLDNDVEELNGNNQINDDEDSHLRLQKQLGNGENHRSTDISVLTTSSDQKYQQPISKDPLVLKTSTLPTTSTIQYHNVYNRPDQCPTNILS